MSLMEKFIEAINSKNVELLDEIIHDDYTFNMNNGSGLLSKGDVIAWSMSDSFSRDEQRIIYENSDIGVEHAVVSFSNGTPSEAVISVHVFKDGKIISTETGATELKE
jgi:hypothetical protein